jgi:hypothetical protein
MRGLVTLALVAALLGPVAAPVAAQDAAQAQANAALRADPEIWGSLTALAIARELGRRCATLEERTFRGRTHVVGLYNRARGLGFSRAQIMAFIDDDAEKARLRAEVTQWFAARGLREGGPSEGFCALGREQIAGGTLAGTFLRAR